MIIVLSVASHSSVERCSVTSSWWQVEWKCRLIGWFWRRVALTFVPCLQVHKLPHTAALWCFILWFCYLIICVFCRWYEWKQSPTGGDQRGGRGDAEETGRLYLHSWDWSHRGQCPGENVGGRLCLIYTSFLVFLSQDVAYTFCSTLLLFNVPLWHSLRVCIPQHFKTQTSFWSCSVVLLSPPTHTLIRPSLGTNEAYFVAAVKTSFLQSFFVSSKSQENNLRSWYKKLTTNPLANGTIRSLFLKY